MINASILTQKRLMELLEYDSSTGAFYWRVNRGPQKIGSPAGTLNKVGYVQITIDRKIYLAHRLAWLYVNGAFPSYDIDHINRVKNDNRIENLRIALPSENHQNKGKSASNKSGVIGVCWDSGAKKWRSYIRLKGKLIHLGLHPTIERAKIAREEAKAQYHTFSPKNY